MAIVVLTLVYPRVFSRAAGRYYKEPGSIPYLRTSDIFWRFHVILALAVGSVLETESDGMHDGGFIYVVALVHGGPRLTVALRNE
jgi:hypothetical protein